MIFRGKKVIVCKKTLLFYSYSISAFPFILLILQIPDTSISIGIAGIGIVTIQ